MEPPPLDPTYQELSHLSAQAVADVARSVITAEGVRWLKAVVTSAVTEGSRRFVTIRRAEQDAADAKPYPVLHTGVMPAVNDWVSALETPGGLVILGVEQNTTDTTLAGLAQGGDLATNSVNSRALASGSTQAARAVATEHVQDAAITNPKISSMDGGKLHSRSVPDAALAQNYQAAGNYAPAGNYAYTTGDTFSGPMRFNHQAQLYGAVFMMFGNAGPYQVRRDTSVAAGTEQWLYVLP